MTDTGASDLAVMQRALQLAERGRGHVEPNPLVGAVLVNDGKVVGEGWHQRFGGPHAEIEALTAAGEAARGGTLYVTLEPCCHHGKTPPCTDAVFQAGLQRVVAALADPFPPVAGRSFTILRDAGVTVEVGVAADQAAELNAPYLKLLQTGRPYVIAKWAMSLDGKTATHTGESRWISSPAARQRVHELRGRMDGIVIGIGTVLTDDPLLTARPAGPRVATRIILDSRLRLPLDSQLVRTVSEAPLLIAHSDSADGAKRLLLEKAGCECLALEPPSGRPFVRALLNELGRRRFTNLLVEGGSEVLGSFFEIQEVDEFQVFVAPKLIGGRLALSPVGGAGVAKMTEALAAPELVVERIAEDVLLRGRLRRRPQ
jgi:diaminohydroxyphosphoribosylaminopyrimidine deaminase/5-amino-6-(5-phosphoribosylamino)uracil reductase